MYYNDWLARRCCYSPARIAIVDDIQGRTYTYSDLNQRATRVASYLQRERNVGAGDRVACISTNRIEYLDLFFACGKLGAVLVPINYRLPPAAVLDLLSDAEPRVFTYESDFEETARAAMSSGAVESIVPLGGDQLPSDADSIASQAAYHRHAGMDAEAHEANEQDVAMILYTSGTTGRPKGAMVTWRQIHWNAMNTIIGLQLSEQDVAFLNMPLYHTGAWHVMFTPLMLVGGRLILQKRFDPQRCNDRVGPEGVTILFGVPTMLRMMLDSGNFAAADFATVRFAICGGEPCPLPVIDAYRRRGVAIRQGYGLTEAGPNCFSLPAQDAERKEGSIGFPNFFVGIRLVKESGELAGVGEVGELQMKGPHVFAGYWRNAAETAQAFQEGWLRTGDLLRQDEEGYCYVVGRKKEMYISGGENVYPVQVERILQSHKGVAQAAVIGVPDPQWGETGWAFVRLHDAADCTISDLLGWCRQHLAKYQCPHRISLVTELPVGPSGKTDKLALASMARNQLKRS